MIKNRALHQNLGLATGLLVFNKRRIGLNLTGPFTNQQTLEEAGKENRQRWFGALWPIKRMVFVESTLHHLRNDLGVSPTSGLDAALWQQQIVEQVPPRPPI